MRMRKDGLQKLSTVDDDNLHVSCHHRGNGRPQMFSVTWKRMLKGWFLVKCSLNGINLVARRRVKNKT